MQFLQSLERGLIYEEYVHFFPFLFFFTLFWAAPAPEAKPLTTSPVMFLNLVAVLTVQTATGERFELFNSVKQLISRGLLCRCGI